MSKNWNTRLTETWAFIDSISGAPATTITALKTYHNNLTAAVQRAVSNAMAQGDYTHAKPGILTWGNTRTQMETDRATEKDRRAYRRAMILILMAKQNSGVPMNDLNRAVAAVPTNVTGEAKERVLAELKDLQTSIIQMKAGGQVNDINWAGWDGTKRRPLLAGSSIGRRGSLGPGTLGCFVNIGTDVYILSNAHVLRQASLGTTMTDDEIIQPPHQLGGSYFDVVAEFHAELTTHDAAVAKVVSGISCTNATVQGVAITGSAAAGPGGAIIKSGCATRERKGTIANLNAPNVNTSATTTLVDQLLIDRDDTLDASPHEKFQVKGDSGSVAIDHNGRVVALLHGQAGGTSVQGTHIDPILNYFGATVFAGTQVAP